MEDEEELKRQSLLLEQLSHNESFRLWRDQVVTPVLDNIDGLLASADAQSEPVLRANVKLRFLVRDMFFGIFDQVAAGNRQDREQETNK